MEAILFEMYISSNSMSFAKDVPITVAVIIDKGYRNPMYLVENFVSMPVPEDAEIKLKKIGIIETVSIVRLEQLKHLLNPNTSMLAQNNIMITLYLFIRTIQYMTGK